MKKEYILISLFFLITAIFFYLFYRITVPFFAPLSWAAVFVILFYPMYEKLQKHIKSQGVVSLLLCLFIVVLIIGPMVYLFAALVQEAADAVAKVNEAYQSGELDKYLSFDLPWIEAAKERLAPYYDVSSIDAQQIIKDSADKLSGVIFSQTSWLIANGTRAIFYFALMTFSMYYLFKDGYKLVRKLKRLMPLTQKQTDRTFAHLRDVIQATMYGGMVVALLQGLMGGILFAVMGIPSAIFWGAVMALMSIIPLVGAFIIFIPAGVILMIGGAWVKGLIVIGIGTLVISQVDNVIRPWLISGRTQMHPLLLFLSILGGISLFGLLGVVVGPLIAAVFVTLIEIFDVRLHPEEKVEAATEEG